MKFGENYQKFFNNIDQRNGLHNETLIGLLIEKYVYYQPNLILGDSGLLHLPDLYSDDFKTGFEIVQCELDCDLEMKKFYRVMDVTHGEPLSTFKLLQQKGFNIAEYDFYGDENNNIIAAVHKEYGRTVGYLEPIYKDNIEKKLKKLNNGNYSMCTDISLVISNIERRKGMHDAELVKSIYEEISPNFKNKFLNIYLVTTDGIFKINDKVSVIHSFANDEFAQAVREMKSILQFENE